MKKNNPISRLGWKLFLVGMGFMLMSLCIFQKSFALSLEIGPDEIIVENVPLGKPVAISSLAGQKMKLKIINKDASACNYTIGILANAQTTAPLSDGYQDVPEATWIYPQVEEVKVAGFSFQEVELWINIPQDKKYSGQRYQAVVEVKTKKNNPRDLFVLAGQLKINFSTVISKEAQDGEK